MTPTENNLQCPRFTHGPHENIEDFSSGLINHYDGVVDNLAVSQILVRIREFDMKHDSY